MDKNQIIEALKIQPLSEEEKANKKILGRLCGPIATCTESTRNGRKYNRQLWENALNDDLFKEKIQNKCLFLELGHPADRAETDMREVCACIPAVPEIIDNDLYASVDILDTPNGRILKTLCDYGFIPGISSRGSGDIMDNNEVDPETFFLECWDVVAIPAVKKARLAMCESLESKKSLSSALCESLAGASAEDKKRAQEALNNLGVKVTLDESLDELKESPSTFPGGTPRDVNKIPFAIEDSLDNSPVQLRESDEEECECDWCHELYTQDELKKTDLGNLCDKCIKAIKSRGEDIKILTEDLIETESVDKEDTAIKDSIETDVAGSLRSLVNSEWSAIGEYTNTIRFIKGLPDYDHKAKIITRLEDIAGEEAVHVGELEKLFGDIYPEIEAKIADGKEEEIPESTVEESLSTKEEEITVKDLIKELTTEYEKNATVISKDLIIDDKTYATEFSFEKDEDGNLTIGVNCVPTEEDNKDIEVASDENVEIDAESDKTSSAEDIGDIGVIEQLKETIRQKDSLESEVKTLIGEKAVRDSEVEKLKEDLQKYKSAFERMGAVAAMNKNAVKDVQVLTEQLAQKDQEIETLKQKHTVNLNESFNKTTVENKRLTEELKVIKEELTKSKTELTEQLKQYKTKVEQRTEIAKQFKSKLNEALTQYVEFRSNLLGVKPSEITSKLTENYTAVDVDKVCDSLLTENLNINRLPFGITRDSKIRINESAEGKKLNTKKNTPEAGYEIDDDLLELAGLK